METTLYNIAGYRFNNWSLVKELYTPVSATTSTKTLKDRSRSGLVDHLQYYAVPNGKLFIAFRAFAQMSTLATVGIFGTRNRYSPQTDPASVDWVVGGTYWCGGTGWGTLVRYGGTVYECQYTHTGHLDYRPPHAYWITGGPWAEGWVEGSYYFQAQVISKIIDEVDGTYRCISDHTATTLTAPCETDWETKWVAGDEFIKNRAIDRQNMNIANGTVMPFGVEVIGVFEGNSTGGRWLGAKTNSGTMGAGATLFGIEVDEEYE